MVDSSTFVPQRKLITDPGYVPASPFIATDASRNYNRWNAYWLQPRGTLGPMQIGLHGLGNMGLAACCDACAKGAPCTGCLNGFTTGRYNTTGVFTPSMGGMSGIVEDMQDKTDGYAIPVILGSALGYLAERKSGAIFGAVAGAGLKWVYATYLNPFVAPLLPGGVDGFRDDFRFNPEVSPLDSQLDRSAFRFLQLILIVGATTLAVKVLKKKPLKANGRRRNRARNGKSSFYVRRVASFHSGPADYTQAVPKSAKQAAAMAKAFHAKTGDHYQAVRWTGKGAAGMTVLFDTQR